MRAGWEVRRAAGAGVHVLVCHVGVLVVLPAGLVTAEPTGEGWARLWLFAAAQGRKTSPLLGGTSFKESACLLRLQWSACLTVATQHSASWAALFRVLQLVLRGDGALR